jgi:hypothetical protein
VDNDWNTGAGAQIFQRVEQSFFDLQTAAAAACQFFVRKVSAQIPHGCFPKKIYLKVD